MNRQEFLIAFASIGFTLSFGSSSRFPVNVKCMSSNPKAKKPEFFYGFPNEDKMFLSLQYNYDNLKNYVDLKQKRKDTKKEARANMVNPFKVGQVLYDSWGYEQTNIDFYQVIEVKPKSIVLRPIAGKFVPSEGYSSMAGMVAPDIDNFAGEAIVKTLVVTSYSTVPRISSKHGAFHIYEKGEKGVYCSWYA